MILATALWLLPAGQAGAACVGIGAAQSCTDGLDRTYNSDQSTRHVIAINKPLLAKKPPEAIPAPTPDPGPQDKKDTVVELKAADRALNFTSMYPGFGGVKPLPALTSAR